MKTIYIAHFLIGIFGNATAMFLFLAPMITFKRFIWHKSTEQFSGVPYLMTLLSCLLFGWYGLPFVSPHNRLVSTISGSTGAAIEFTYVVIFIIYTPKKEKAKILGILTFVLTVFSIVALVSLFALHGHTRKLFCGIAATIFTIIMYASPLLVGTVTRTKSVEFMPFFLSLFVFLSGTSWLIFGLLGHDPFVAVSNGFGCGLGAMQLMLYFIYRDNKKSTTPEESVEMGLPKPHHVHQERHD